MVKTYDKYKDSGIAWIGDIPSEWKVMRVKHAFTRKKEKSLDKNPVVLSLARDGVKVRDISNNEGQLAESYEGYNPVVPFDLLLNPMDLYSGANCSLSKVYGVISPAYINLRANNNFSPVFYDYYFKIQYWTMAFFAHGKGISFDNRWTLGNETLNNYPLITPSYKDQQKIASFLDSKCSEIDSLISLQEEMISELQAYKQSVITEAVTKGLDPNAKMKDSGEDWLGEIPGHWNLLPIRALFTKRNQKNNPIISTERLSLSIGVGITRYADKTTNLDRFKDDFTAYQLAYPEDIVLNSMNMIVGAVGKSAFMGCVSPVYYVITAKEGVSPDFYGYLLNCPKIREVYHSLGRGIYAIERGDGRVNTCRLKVPYYDFSIINVPVPSYEDQIKIASYINNKISQIDSLISLKQEKIKELKDYKKSIIYEYVTGKKRV